MATRGNRLGNLTSGSPPGDGARALTVRIIAPLGASLVLGGCGLDGVFLTPRGFDPTAPKHASISGSARPGADVQAWARSGEAIASATADDSGRFTLDLPPGADGASLRVYARAGAWAAKVIVPATAVDADADAGTLDAAATARALVAEYEILQQAGSTFLATPPPALATLLGKLTASPTPELGAFTAIVSEALSAADGASGAPSPFSALGFDLAAGAAGPSDLGARYRAALGAAAAGYALEIRCDPARLNVMFTVDASGRGLDGNGAPQLIRQVPKEGKVYVGFTADESSPIRDASIPAKLAPNDPRYAMTDDGKNGDEVAGDGLYTVVVALPRGARIQYKYTDGAAGEGFTGTEEWPGNSRILQVEDVLTGRPDGQPDCLVIRRDSFGDEASNKNFVNLNTAAKQRGGTVSFDADLGGEEVPLGHASVRVGGLQRDGVRTLPPLTPRGVPEARENGVCSVCPAPLVLDPDDHTPPTVVRADRTAVDRVLVRFSEPIDTGDATSLANYQYVDETGLSVTILSATPSGTDVLLVTAPTHPRSPARLHVKPMRDLSVAANVLEETDVDVGPDATPPKVLSVRSLSILDVDPSTPVSDPTTGDLVELVVDERPEASAATDPSRYRIEGLQVLAAVVLGPESGASSTYRIRLVTETQAKSVPYVLRVVGLRDAAGNAVDQEVPFEGYALYRVHFGVVPGFAFADSSGATRGIPRGEKLYLTGTPLAGARALDGRDISITSRGASRTDVTGWPQFELQPGMTLPGGQKVYELTLLLPHGSWAWKAAHGVEGEYQHPPTTLEKVYKTLATTNDSSGVRVDPRTMTAENGLSYAGAHLSETGDEPPRSSVVFKREAPDEVCEVHGDADCPTIVIGAWRDLALDGAGHTRDYDDGLVTLPPHHPDLPDFSPPKLLDARARDSFSILLSFDEAIDAPAEKLSVSLVRADDGYGVPVSVLSTTEVKPHQAVVTVQATSCDQALGSGVAYTLSYSGATDRTGHTDERSRTQTVLAPDGCQPLSPLSDHTPPRLVSVTATDLTELVVRFDERLDPATAAVAANYSVQGAGAELAVQSAEVQPDRASVRLVTAVQQILQPYTLTVAHVQDAADPPNLLDHASIDFTGFGDRDPPQVVRVRAIASDRVLVRFDEALDAPSALDATHYRIDGLSILAVEFSGDPARRAYAFNPALAPRIRDVALLHTAPMTSGTNYALVVDGVRDLSGNPCQATRAFTGVSEAPVVDVVLEYAINDTQKVAGSVPSRAISPAMLAESREGVFVLGARQGPDGLPVPGITPPVNDALGGFGVEGQPLDGIEPRLSDNGTPPDVVAGDSVFTILVPHVPLGTTMMWKAFASYSTTYRDQNPGDPLAAFADPLPGPSVFSDGQEYPGNENGAVILDDGSSDGQVRVRCLFGDEVTYKKNTGGPAYVWVYGDR